MRLYLEPADNMLIRDGRPFNQDDAGRASAASRFPPPPDTVYGAVRVALARALGWDGVGDWMQGSAEGPKQLGGFGENAEKAARLRVAGPFFTVNETPLLPLPAAAAVMKNGDIRLCLPAIDASNTDIGDVRLLALPEQGAKLLAGRWAPAAAVRRLLAGATLTAADCAVDLREPPKPRLLLHQARPLPGIAIDDLGAKEMRVGLERNADTRLAEEGKLYASVRRVLPPGVRLYVEVSGVDVAANAFTVPIPFGGEGRFVFIERAVADPPASSAPNGQYFVMLTTPAVLPALKIGVPVTVLPGTLVSAVVTEITATAGFARSAIDARALTAPRAVLPPGTTLYMAGGDGHELPDAIGDRYWRGYGRFETGVWNDG